MPVPLRDPIIPVAGDAELRAQLVAIEGVDAQVGLRNLRGDTAGYLRLLHKFDTAHGDDMRILDAHFADGATDEVLRLVHTLKGVAGTLGLMRLQEAVKALEETLRSHGGERDGEETTHLVESVSAAQRHLHEALARLTVQAEPGRSIEVDPAETRGILDRLRALLATDDTAVNALFLESEALLRSTFGPAVAPLGEQIEAFDYPAALKTLESLLAALAGSRTPPRTTSRPSSAPRKMP